MSQEWFRNGSLAFTLGCAGNRLSLTHVQRRPFPFRNLGMSRETSDLFFSYSQPLVVIVVGILYKRWGCLPISSREALIHGD